MVDEVALEGEGGEEEVFCARLVDSAASVEFAVFGEMNAVADGDSGAPSRVNAAGCVLEKITVVGNGEVNVLVGGAQAVNEEGRNIGKSPGFGA